MAALSAASGLILAFMLEDFEQFILQQKFFFLHLYEFETVSFAIDSFYPGNVVI
jgi:hypothetical protein